jgi:anti-sigma regulatory factor (Ser/Thr protein kinase)
MELSENSVSLHYNIDATDFSSAGEASSNVKKTMTKLGINPSLIKKVAIAMYEAEINTVIHASGGIADVTISPTEVVVVISDHGPGIADIDQAMKEGFSTASDTVREMGFGAGMGLSNMKRYSDELSIESTVGVGTKVTIKVIIAI